MTIAPRRNKKRGDKICKMEDQTKTNIRSISSDDLLLRAQKIRESIARAKQGKKKEAATLFFTSVRTFGDREEEETSSGTSSGDSREGSDLSESHNDTSKLTLTTTKSTDVSAENKVTKPSSSNKLDKEDDSDAESENSSDSDSESESSSSEEESESSSDESNKISTVWSTGDIGDISSLDDNSESSGYDDSSSSSEESSSDESDSESETHNSDSDESTTSSQPLARHETLMSAIGCRNNKPESDSEEGSKDIHESEASGRGTQESDSHSGSKSIIDASEKDLGGIRNEVKDDEGENNEGSAAIEDADIDILDVSNQEWHVATNSINPKSDWDESTTASNSPSRNETGPSTIGLRKRAPESDSDGDSNASNATESKVNAPIIEKSDSLPEPESVGETSEKESEGLNDQTENDEVDNYEDGAIEDTQALNHDSDEKSASEYSKDSTSIANEESQHKSGDDSTYDIDILDISNQESQVDMNEIDENKYDDQSTISKNIAQNEAKSKEVGLRKNAPESDADDSSNSSKLTETKGSAKEVEESVFSTSRTEVDGLTDQMENGEAKNDECSFLKDTRALSDESSHSESSTDSKFITNKGSQHEHADDSTYDIEILDVSNQESHIGMNSIDENNLDQITAISNSLARNEAISNDIGHRKNTPESDSDESSIESKASLNGHIEELEFESVVDMSSNRGEESQDKIEDDESECDDVSDVEVTKALNIDNSASNSKSSFEDSKSIADEERQDKIHDDSTYDIEILDVSNYDTEKSRIDTIIDSVGENAISNHIDAGSIDDPESFFASISKQRENRKSQDRSQSTSQGSSNAKKSMDRGVFDDPESFFAKIAKSRKISTERDTISDSDSCRNEDSQNGTNSNRNEEDKIDDPHSFFEGIAKSRENSGSRNSKLNSDKSRTDDVAVDDPDDFFARIAKAREKAGITPLESDSEQDDLKSNGNNEIAVDDPETFSTNILITQETCGSKSSRSDSREISASKGRSDDGVVDDPDDFFARIAKAREKAGVKSLKSDSQQDSPKSKGGGDIAIDNPGAYFESIAKARENFETSNMNTDQRDDLKKKEKDEVAIDDPEAFFANISKARQTRGNTDSNSDGSSSAERSKDSDEASIDDSEAFFAKILDSRETSGSQQSTPQSMSEQNSSGTSDEESIDDPEVYFSNLLRDQEKGDGKNEIGDSYSESDSSHNYEVEEPNDVHDNGLGDSYERFLAGLSNGTSSDDVPREEIEQFYVDTDPPNERYVSNNYEEVEEEEITFFQDEAFRESKASEGQFVPDYSEDEEEITFLHEEMQKIGLSPTVLVNRDDGTHTSGRSSIGGDSYLEDLLMQREEREDDHREEIMDETLDYYDSIHGPKSEGLFLEVLGMVTKEKQEEFEKRDMLQDKLISKELELRQQHPSMSNIFSGKKPKTKKQIKAEQYPEIGQPLPDGLMKSNETSPRPMRNQKKKDKPSSPNRKRGKKTDENETYHRSPRRVKDNRKRGQKKNTALPRADDLLYDDAPEEPTYHNERSKHSSARRNNENCKKKKNILPIADKPKERTSRAKNRRNNHGIDRGRKHKAALPRVARRPTAIPEEPSSNDSVSSNSSHASQLSINGFEDEYYYDVERAEMDRQALSLLQQEAQMSRKVFSVTKKRMIASSLMCCLAFALILVFIIDPLQRRSEN